MKTVKLSLLAVVVATAVSPSAFAGDTVEAATTELTAIQPGMSQSEIDQKIGRFLERTGNSAAAQNYLIVMITGQRHLRKIQLPLPYSPPIR